MTSVEVRGGCARSSPAAATLGVVHYWLLLFLSTLAFTCRARPGVTAPDTQDCMMQWILSLGVDQLSADSYHGNFQRELIDQRNVHLFSMSQLQQLGVDALGHRALIHNAAISGTQDSCRNGGSCNYDRASGAYGCSCVDGFTGALCQTGDCSGNPCKNGGYCSEESGGTICCTCPVGYHGDLCQYLLTDNYSLSKAVVKLSSELQTLKETSKNATLAVADTVRGSTGLRFFRPWLEISLIDAIFIRHFVIGSRSFIGIITHNGRQVISGVVIYELLPSEELVYLQTLAGMSASSFKSFTLGAHHYLVVGHHYDVTLKYPPRVNSELYRWNNTLGKFLISTEPESNFRTRGVMDVDHILLEDNSSFIAFAAHDNETSYNISTYIYRHHPSSGRDFYHFSPNLPTTGASRVNFYNFDSVTYLFIAEEYSASNDSMTKSSIYRWESNHFALFQEIETNGANDLFPFSVGDNFFFVAVNYGHEPTINVQSKIYRMCEGVFEFYYAIDTKGGRKADFFRIGIESFLVFSNFRDDTQVSVATNSVIYRVEGAKFVSFQEILTQNAMYVHAFKLRTGCQVLAFANKAEKPRLYKWTSMSDENDC